MNDTTPWRKAAIKKAQREILDRDQPEGCGAHRWRAVQELLLVLAEHLPNIEVSQKTLTAKLFVAPRTVKYRVAWAIELGVLEVIPVPTYHGHWDHNHYHLLGITAVGHDCPSTGGNRFLRTGGNGCPQRSTSYGGRQSQNLSSRDSSKGKISVPSGAGRVRMSDYDPDFVTSAKPEEYLPQPAAVLKNPRKPVGVVTQHFRDGWEQILAQPGGTYFNGVLLFDSVAAFQTRVKQDCLGRDGQTVEEVCGSIDTFLAQVASRREVPKDGQALWKLWWSKRGKYHSTKADESKLRIPTMDDHRRRLGGSA